MSLANVTIICFGQNSSSSLDSICTSIFSSIIKPVLAHVLKSSMEKKQKYRKKDWQAFHRLPKIKFKDAADMLASPKLCNQNRSRMDLNKNIIFSPKTTTLCSFFLNIFVWIKIGFEKICSYTRAVLAMLNLQ